jgi:hypothetical protein
VPSIVTTVPPLTIKSTTVFLLCANADEAAPEINRTSNSEATIFVIISLLPVARALVQKPER